VLVLSIEVDSPPYHSTTYDRLIFLMGVWDFSEVLCLRDLATRMRVAVANPASLMSIMFMGVRYCPWASPRRLRFSSP
jgi:hypothetical protein